MTSSRDPLRTLILDWAEQETQSQITPLTSALLRCKARLAEEDARRARLRRLQFLLLVPPALLALWLCAGLGSASQLLQSLLALSTSTLGSILAIFGLGALVAPALTTD